jgi:hypothetical protein
MSAMASWRSVLGLAWGLSLAAQDAAPTSFLHRALLDRAPWIVRARLDPDRMGEAERFRLTPFRILETLRGPQQESILVRTPSERLRAYPELEKLLFLVPLPSGSTADLVDLVDLTAADRELVPALVRSYLGIHRDLPFDQRISRRFDLAWDALGTGSVFAVRTALREIEDLLEQAPRRFRPGDPGRFLAVERKVPAEDRALFGVLARRLDQAAFGAFAPAVQAARARGAEAQAVADACSFREAGDDAERFVWMEERVRELGRRSRLLLEGALLEGSEAVRARASWWLGEIQDGEAAAALLGGLAASGGLERIQRIEALGKLGDPSALQALVDELRIGRYEEEVLLAIARIGDAEAQDLLDAWVRAAPTDATRSRRVEALRSREFREAEARRRDLGRRRYGR